MKSFVCVLVLGLAVVISAQNEGLQHNNQDIQLQEQLNTHMEAAESYVAPSYSAPAKHGSSKDSPKSTFVPSKTSSYVPSKTSSYGSSGHASGGKPAYRSYAPVAPAYGGYSYQAPAPTVPCAKNVVFSCAPTVVPVPCAAPPAYGQAPVYGQTPAYGY